MKLKNKTRLLNELSKEVASPKEFIYAVMTLQQQSVEDVVKDVGMTSAHFYVAMNQIEKGQGIGIKVCVKIAEGLDIDPTILNRIVADYNLKNVFRRKEKTIMELIRTFREKHQTKRQAEIQEQAEALIRVADFADDLYIAYNGVSLVPIEKDWTSVQILQELNKLRQNYVKSRMKGNEFQQVVTVF